MKTKLSDQRKFERWAMPKLKQLQRILLLQHFEPLTIEFKAGIRETANCQFAYPYQTITIRYSEDLLKDFLKGKKDHVLAILAHEMCHRLTDALYGKACNQWRSKEEVEDEREKLTDHIANIVLKNRLI